MSIEPPESVVEEAKNLKDMVESIRGPISFQAFQKPAVKYNVTHYITS